MIKMINIFIVTISLTVMSGCGSPDSKDPKSSVNKSVRFKCINGSGNTISHYKDMQTNKEYMAIYNVGIIEIEPTVVEEQK